MEAEVPESLPMSAGKKRARSYYDDVEDGDSMLDCDHRLRFEKRPRPTSGDSNVSDHWAHARDSVISTPRSIINVDLHQLQRMPFDDSDDQDSLVSEPSVFQPSAMSPVDEEMGDDDRSPFDQIDGTTARSPIPRKPWQSSQPRAQQTNRVATPMLPPPLSSHSGVRPISVHTRFGQHVRHRHPQENISNIVELLEVPSPTDEDEVPTPPSAAEAAGSQLSMLSFHDVEMDTASDLPTISINPAHGQGALRADMAITEGFEPMDATNHLAPGLMVRKQRARSGALSSAKGSPSISSFTQAEPTQQEQELSSGVRRAFSIGFRADCAKCRARVPGHMNHFIT